VTTERAVQIPANDVVLDGDLALPAEPLGLVIFAHGSGSGRHSRRNRAVAGSLQERGLATLLIDLLTPEEEAVDARTAHLRFDIPLLASRLLAACEWASHDMQTHSLAIGLFGASTGGGAALIAAGERPELVGAVVSRGGRPDLAGDALPHVRAPTLLIVGGFDDVVLRLNQQARGRMTAAVELSVIPGATHLFEEPGALEIVAEQAGDWFARHLSAG
jgi:putative phosphoribosyl transferase